MKTAETAKIITLALALATGFGAGCATSPYQRAGNPDDVASALARRGANTARTENAQGRPLAFLVALLSVLASGATAQVPVGLQFLGFRPGMPAVELEAEVARLGCTPSCRAARVRSLLECTATLPAGSAGAASPTISLRAVVMHERATIVLLRARLDAAVRVRVHEVDENGGDARVAQGDERIDRARRPHSGPTTGRHDRLPHAPGLKTMSPMMTAKATSSSRETRNMRPSSARPAADVGPSASNRTATRLARGAR